MSQVHSIRFAHPKTRMPDSELRHDMFLCEPWAEDIMKTHMTSSDMMSRLRPHEWDSETPCYMSVIDLEDMADMCLDGFTMVDFWVKKLACFTAGWDRWYVYVSKSSTEGWSLTLLLNDKGKTEEDAKDISRTLWAMYKAYFDCKLSSYTPNGQTLYRECHYEHLKDELMSVSTEDGYDIGQLIDKRMMVTPPMGAVYRTARYGGGCFLCCTTNDTSREDAQSLKLWYP